MTILRWILLVPAVIASWYGAIVLGVVSLAVRDYFCPAEYLVSGMCSGRFGAITDGALMMLFSGLSATLVVLTSTMIAPSHKGYVAMAALATGSAFATFFLFLLNFHVWKEFISALTFGAVTFYLVLKRHPVRSKYK